MWTVTTFSSIWAEELDWEWVDGSGEVLFDYNWPGDLITTVDTVCVTSDCGYLRCHSFEGTGWGLGPSVTVTGPDGVTTNVQFTDGELGYVLLNGLEVCDGLPLPGCLDATAINFTPGANVDDGSCDYISTVTWAGAEREYILHTPPGGAAGKPLVFCLHGLSGTMEHMRRATQWNALADAEGFSICYPQGTLWNWDGSLLPYWNANLFLTPADDVGFLTDLAQTLQATHNTDPLCTYVTGASNGGMMAYTLLCERPDTWRGMVTVGGVMSAHDQQFGTTGLPRAVLHLHGTDDTAMPYYAYEGGGGPWTGGWGVMEMMDYWATAHGHTQLDSVPLLDEIPGDGLTEDVLTWSGGMAPVVHHRVNGGGHEWWGANGVESEVNTTEIAWDFLADLCANSVGVHPEAPAAPAVAAYPNPARPGEQLSLKGLYPRGPVRWEFTDVRGVVCARGTAALVAPEAPGTYVLRYESEQATHRVVVVVQ